jgi:hypothetical protein
MPLPVPDSLKLVAKYKQFCNIWTIVSANSNMGDLMARIAPCIIRYFRNPRPSRATGWLIDSTACYHHTEDERVLSVRRIRTRHATAGHRVDSRRECARLHARKHPGRSSWKTKHLRVHTVG